MILHTNHYIRTIMKKNLLSLGGSAFATFLFIFSFSSCHDEEVDNTSELAYRHAYEDNFVKQYGEINPNQTWDFSSYAKRYKLNGALTRATMDDTYKSIAQNDGYYYVPSNITTYITDNFEERADNSGQTKAFVLNAEEECDFEVAFVYQGRSEPNYDLYAVIFYMNGDTPTTEKKYLFSKGKIEASRDGSNYDELGTTWSGGDGPWTNPNVYSSVRSKPVLIHAPKNSFIYFYIKITDPCTSDGSSVTSSHQFGWAGDELASIDTPHTIGLVDIATPQNIKDIDPNYEAYLLAVDDFCLTCKKAGIVTDNSLNNQDFNDCMFLIAGNVPTPSTVDVGDIKTLIEKRYMIEDLYGYDYDFNDIVVDASQETVTPYTFVHPTTSNPSGEFVVHYDRAEKTQSATIQWLCGTLPFQIGIGDYTFNQVTDPTNKTQTLAQLNGTSSSTSTTPATGFTTGIDPKFKVDFDQTTTPANPWNPSTNNITAYIWTKGTSPTASYSYSKDGIWDNGWTGVWTSEFPEKGDVPYIIAVDPNVNWMGEKESIFEAHPDWNGGDMTSGN